MLWFGRLAELIGELRAGWVVLFIGVLDVGFASRIVRAFTWGVCEGWIF